MPDENDVDQREHTTVRETSRVWTPAQVVSGIIGLGFIVMGGVALIRVGFADLTETANVGWYAHTGILAIIEIVLGLIFLSAAARALEARSTLVSIGVLMIAFGLIAIIEPGGTEEYLGDATTVGWTYLIIGVVAAVLGLTAPLIASRSRRDVWETTSRGEASGTD